MDGPSIDRYVVVAIRVHLARWFVGACIVAVDGAVHWWLMIRYRTQTGTGDTSNASLKSAQRLFCDTCSLLGLTRFRGVGLWRGKIESIFADLIVDL